MSKKERTEAQKRADKKYEAKRSARTRNFATVIYPESAPADWQAILSGYHIPVLVSPLHDKDLNPNGEFKKPHYHVLVMFESVKDFERQVKPIFDSIGGVGREDVISSRGYARYLCHLDNPEKAQYNPNDILSYGGADYSAIIHLPTDDSKMLRDIFAFVRANQIFSLAHLIDICAVNNPDWFNLITMSRAYIVDKYIKSMFWESDVAYNREASEI